MRGLNEESPEEAAGGNERRVVACRQGKGLDVMCPRAVRFAAAVSAAAGLAFGTEKSKNVTAAAMVIDDGLDALGRPV